jgi:PAS domain S-box-containing protein
MGANWGECRMEGPSSEMRDLRQVFDAMVDGVLHFDTEGRIVLANRAACRMLGWDPTAREIAELGLAARLFHRDGSALPTVEYPAVRALAGETMRDQPLLFGTSGGRMVSVLSSASPLLEQGLVVGAIASFHDVTSLEEANARLRDTALMSAALIRIGAIVSSTLEVDEIMQAAIRETCDAVSAETAAIVMREDGAWVTRYSYRFPTEIIGVALTDEEAPHAAMAFRTAAPVAIDDAYQDPRVNRSVMEGYGIRSVLTMPLIVQRRVVGVMFMNHHAAPVAFTPAQVQFASNVATTISLALHNAELYEGQRTVADTLQQAMLTMPERLPGVEFSCLYRSATESARVGGDFYDIFEAPDGRVGVTIGDVSGKGLGAAATASMVKNTVRAYALAGDAPADVLRKTNGVMRFSLDPASFVSVLFGLLDPSRRVFTYCSGGHPPAVLLGADRRPRLLREGGTVIGPVPDAAYRQETCALGPKDLLVLYTDGLTEAGSAGARYGEERLLAVLRGVPPRTTPERLVESLFFDALDFAGGTLSDDLALLAIRPSAQSG